MDGQALPRTRPTLPIGSNERCVLVHPSYPSGHSFTAKQADAKSIALVVCSSSCHSADWLTGCPTEFGPIDPHAMQDNSELTGEGHFGELHAAPLCDPHRPATQARPAAVMHQDVCGMGRCVWL